MKCAVISCPNEPYAKGWCQSHYMRWYRHGDPLGGRAYSRPAGMAPAEVFRWHMPEAPPLEGCWDWRGPVYPTGYGLISTTINGRPSTVGAHRVSCEIFNGQIPQGWEVLHSCDRKVCVQPLHLAPGTAAQNSREAVERGRYHRGQKCWNAKLTPADITWIRNEAELTNVEIAAAVGVTPTNIGHIKKGKTWKT